MENGFGSPSPSPRTYNTNDSFPAGLRVLVVDDDPTWLKILEKMLKKCSYEVTTCCLAREALNLLREKKDGFDIVISDVNMPDMDGFKLLEHVGLEMDLPVIMMSVDGETSRVMKGVQHGACDYLLKPVRMKELKNIWQHVLRKKIHEVKDIESYECVEDVPMMINGSNIFDDGQSLSVSDFSSVKKRKDMENKDHDNQDFNDLLSGKKARVLWSVDLHQKFVNAVDQIGLDKVGPKKILDLMNVPWLTRENVASHLQKYRLYLSRLQRQNEPITSFGVIKQSDFTTNDPPTCFGLQGSATMHQNNASGCNFGYAGNNIVVQDSLDMPEGDSESIFSGMTVREPIKASTGDLPDGQRRNGGSRNGPNHSCGSLGIDVNLFGSTTHQQKSWSKEIPMIMFPQQIKKEHESQGHTLLSSSGSQIHVQFDNPRFLSSTSSGTCNSEINKVSTSETKRLCTEYRSSYVNSISPVAHTIGSVSLQSEIGMGDLRDFGPISTSTGSTSTKSNVFDQKCTSNLGFDPQYLLCGSGASLQPSHETLQVCSLQDYEYVENVELSNVEFLDYHDLELFTELPSQSYDRLKFSCEYLSDSLEYPIINEGLFIT
ncbi:hypothetical protein AQUCO_05600105v1 [Aquilegia coerulea]|uniref:Response regulatory domain-containing protein n=1 Tax=Aquilegia coerulea TaxID=218851 RepID=A0A2G5CGI1_AQUCA|nr:hypothetical protein AQUCO_05600105v1 [Aquilegia coerulea]